MTRRLRKASTLGPASPLRRGRSAGANQGALGGDHGRRICCRKGWTPERRAQQAALICRLRPWRCSTGPRSDSGKARSARNALKHGQRSRANILRLQRIRHSIRLCAFTVGAVRARMRGLPLPCVPVRPEDRRPRDIHPAIMQPSGPLWYCPPPQKGGPNRRV